jgi:hypothetical protein
MTPTEIIIQYAEEVATLAGVQVSASYKLRAAQEILERLHAEEMKQMEAPVFDVLGKVANR